MENLNQFEGFMKTIVQEEINQDIAENYFPEEVTADDDGLVYENTITVNFHVIDFELYEKFDEEEEEYETEVVITNVETYDPEVILKEKGIEYSKSNQSDSFYIKLNGEEHRVSDHKRPPVVDGAAVYEHNYENEHIVESTLDIYWKISELIK